MRSVAFEPTSTCPLAPSNVLQAVPASASTELIPEPESPFGPGGPAGPAGPAAPAGPSTFHETGVSLLLQASVLVTMRTRPCRVLRHASIVVGASPAAVASAAALMSI